MYSLGAHWSAIMRRSTAFLSLFEAAQLDRSERASNCAKRGSNCYQVVRTCSGPRCGSFTRAGSSADGPSSCQFGERHCPNRPSSCPVRGDACSERERIPVPPEHPWPVHRFVRPGVSVIRLGFLCVRIGCAGASQRAPENFRGSRGSSVERTCVVRSEARPEGWPSHVRAELMFAYIIPGHDPF